VSRYGHRKTIQAIEYHDLNFDLIIQKTILRIEGKKAMEFFI